MPTGSIAVRFGGSYIEFYKKHPKKELVAVTLCPKLTRIGSVAKSTLGLQFRTILDK